MPRAITLCLNSPICQYSGYPWERFVNTLSELNHKHLILCPLCNQYSSVVVDIDYDILSRANALTPEVDLPGAPPLPKAHNLSEYLRPISEDEREQTLYAIRVRSQGLPSSDFREFVRK